MAKLNSELIQANISADLATLLNRCNFPKNVNHVVCGVSGGADSLALMILALASGLNVEAVHVDHGLRVGSQNEALLVKKYADRFGATFRSSQVIIPDDSDLEQQARIARKNILGPDALTGHTLDDQAETLLINLIRGAGPSGLAAMKPDWRKPILGLSRQETHKICSDLNLEPFVDPSNSNDRFVRNRIRSELLPLLNDISNRDVVPLLVRTAESNRELVEYISGVASEIDPTDCESLRKIPTVVAAHSLREWLRDDLGHPPSSAEIDRVLEVVNNNVLACEISGKRRVARTHNILRVEHDSE